MANTVYDNFVLENQTEDILATKLNLMQFCTADSSLTESAGMKKTIHRYTASGNVQDLAEGVGNNTAIEVSFASKDYTVGTTQGRFIYTDEQSMKDPYAIDVGVNGLADTMVNDFTSKAIAEMENAEIEYAIADAWSFDDFCDALALYPFEQEDGLFMIINPKMKATLRKKLADDLKYVEGFVRTGYVGSVCGVPIFVSKAVPEHIVYIGNRDAIHVFLKKGVESEQERDANTRTNTVYLRKVALVALYDARKLIRMGRPQATTLTASADVSDKAITGAAPTGATVTAYLKSTGAELGHATAASNTYSISSEGFVADDVIVVKSVLADYINASKECTAVA